MNRKALFFDIDGTLFSEIERQVPQSAVLALKKTRQCGNLVFINTGRTVCQTAGIQMEVESDGLLCGCGTYITTGNEVIYDRRIPAERTARLKEDIVRFGLDGVLEGVEGCYFQRGESRMPMVNRLMELLKEGNDSVSQRTGKAGRWNFLRRLKMSLKSLTGAAVFMNAYRWGIPRPQP